MLLKLLIGLCMVQSIISKSISDVCYYGKTESSYPFPNHSDDNGGLKVIDLDL